MDFFGPLQVLRQRSQHSPIFYGLARPQIQFIGKGNGNVHILEAQTKIEIFQP